jgi:hypothetical protein
MANPWNFGEVISQAIMEKRRLAEQRSQFQQSLTLQQQQLKAAALARTQDVEFRNKEFNQGVTEWKTDRVNTLADRADDKKFDLIRLDDQQAHDEKIDKAQGIRQWDMFREGERGQNSRHAASIEAGLNSPDYRNAMRDFEDSETAREMSAHYNQYGTLDGFDPAKMSQGATEQFHIKYPDAYGVWRGDVDERMGYDGDRPSDDPVVRQGRMLGVTPKDKPWYKKDAGGLAQWLSGVYPGAAQRQQINTSNTGNRPR